MGNGIPVQNVSYTAEGMKIVSLNGASDILIRSFEVNNRSDSINGYDGFLGLVLYAYDGKSSWYCNGRSCQSGFVLIKKASNIDHIKTKHWGSTHAKLYKWYFGVEPDYTKVIGAGFAYRTYQETITNSEGQERQVTQRGLLYRSNTFNAFDRIQQQNPNVFKESKYEDYKDEWHDTKREMNIIEQHWVTKAFDAWKQNGYRSKKVYCNAADWKYRKNQSWNNYSYADTVAIEKEYQIYKDKKSESSDEKFDETAYCVVRYMNGTKYYIYFNAPHIKEDMYEYTSSDGYQRSEHGCIRALYRDSNEYSGQTGCVIL